MGYAVGCIVFGFLVGLVVMQMDKKKNRKRSTDQHGENLESKVDEKTRTLEEAAEAFERSEHDGKFTGKKDEMRTVSKGSRRDSTASVPASPLVSRNIPASPLVE